MQLILLERVEGLGNVGDEVCVKAGYGRNFLLPKGRAAVANDANRKVFERRRSILEQQQQDGLMAAKTQAATLAKLELQITRATSDGTHLYGSISTVDLADILHEAGQEVERRQILLDTQIKTVGDHPFRIRLHPDVMADLSVSIASENN